MKRKLELILLIAACLAVMAAVNTYIARRPLRVQQMGDTLARFDSIEEALQIHARQHGRYPLEADWAHALELSPDRIRDPFALAASPEPIAYWSNGEWYVLSSLGPDTPTEVDFHRAGDPLTPQKIDTLVAREFHPHLLDQRTPQELQALFVSREIISDIRWRNAIYDATNGVLSWGDVVHWGGPASRQASREAAGR